MKNLPFPVKLLLVGLVPMCFFSCDGCQDKIGPWMDEHTVEIPKADKTPPVAWFEITDAKTGVTFRAEKDTILNKNNGDNLDIVFWGKDEESGIKKLCLVHGFYQQCCTTDADPRLCSISQPLVVPQCVNMPTIDTRAFISWFMMSGINVSMPCDSGWELESGSYGLTGTVTNSNDLTASVSLVVNVVE